jgi:hypothetical protein
MIAQTYLLVYGKLGSAIALEQEQFRETWETRPSAAESVKRYDGAQRYPRNLLRVAEVVKTFGDSRRMPKLLASSATLKSGSDKPLAPKRQIPEYETERG